MSLFVKKSESDENKFGDDFICGKQKSFITFEHLESLSLSLVSDLYSFCLGRSGDRR